MPSLKNARHERFAQALVAGRSQVAAYLEAGYSGKIDSGTTRGAATRLAANVSVRERVKELQDESAKDAIASGSRLIQEQCRIALSDIGNAFDADGHLLHVTDMPPEFRAAVSSIKVVTKTIPGTKDPVEVEHVSEIKLWDKGAALRDLIPRIVDGDKNADSPLAAFARSLMAGASAIPVATPTDDDDEDIPA